MARNHYEVLGVKKTSSQSEIKTAFRKLVIKYHPDTSEESNALDMFHRITHAYEVLSDRDRRLQYDRLLEVETKQAVVKPRQAATAERPPKKTYASAGRGRVMAVSGEVTRLTLLHSRGQSSMAEKLAQKIISHDPRQPIPYAVLGDLSRSRGDLKQAAKMYAMAVQMDPSNELYHQRHEEMISFAVVGVSRNKSTAASRQLSLMVGVGVIFLAAIYMVLAREQPLLPDLGPISTWTLGVWVMTFLCGVVAGVSMCFAEMLDRFFSVATTALGRVSPVVALATIAVVNFWVAAGIYTVLGFAQNGFNFSTTRVVAATAAITLLLSAAAQFSMQLDALQVLLWGGNLTYMGALCGWMVADSMRR